MTPAYCVNKNCIHFYRRTIKGHTEFMCTVRRGRPVRKGKNWPLGRNIKIERLRVCPLETDQKQTMGYE